MMADGFSSLRCPVRRMYIHKNETVDLLRKDGTVYIYRTMMCTYVGFSRPKLGDRRVAWPSIARHCPVVPVVPVLPAFSTLGFWLVTFQSLLAS